MNLMQIMKDSLALGSHSAQQRMTSSGTVGALSDTQFTLFKQTILQATGIVVEDNKRYWLETRLSRRVRELGLDSYGEYLNRLLKQDDTSEHQALVDTGNN